MTQENSGNDNIPAGSPGSMTPATAGGTDSGVCASCGRGLDGTQSSGFDAFLAKIGITEEMVDSLKNSVSSVDLEQYMNTARDYLKDTGDKARSYTKENPGKVAAGAAALAVGAGLIVAALARKKD